MDTVRYRRSLWVRDGFYVIDSEGSVRHLYAHGQQRRVYSFDSPVVALFESAIRVYVLTTEGKQYALSLHEAPRTVEPWSIHYFLED